MSRADLLALAERALNSQRLSVREALMLACAGHDQEDCAQRGEPSPWRLIETPPTLEDVTWTEERIVAMRLGVAAFLQALAHSNAAGEQGDAGGGA